jgi:hypothetical protein
MKYSWGLVSTSSSATTWNNFKVAMEYFGVEMKQINFKVSMRYLCVNMKAISKVAMNIFGVYTKEFQGHND